MRTWFVVATLATCFAWAGMAQSQDAVERAADIWLQGQDEESLTMLAELARGGNPEARLLLGRIETMDRGPSPYRMSLSREAARMLFRDMSGYSLFGKSWLAVESAEGNKLAQALLRSMQPHPRPVLVKRLNDMNEHQATDHPIRVLALYGSPSARQELRDADYLMDDLKPFLDYLAGTPEPRADGMAALRHIAPEDEKHLITADDPDALGMAGVFSLGFGFGDHDQDNKWRNMVENWLLTAPSAQPIANLCTSECMARAGPCAFAFMALMGGYYESIRIDSPLERIIPQETFVQSPRARLMVLRRAALARTETNQGWLGNHAEIAKISECAADLIVSERVKYQ